MIKFNNMGNKLVFLTTLACLPGISQAATAVSDGFTASLGSWVENTVSTTNTYVGPGFGHNGHLSTTAGVRFPVMGAVNTEPDYSGVFADGIWTASVDLSFQSGTFADAQLRFRFQDATANGWHISLEDTFIVDPDLWETYTVVFDTTWDDATAMANGWVKEPDGTTATPSFSGLWDNVYTSEVRIGATTGSVAGIDNYRTTSPVPVPAAVWLFGSGLIGLIGIARRKKS